MSNLILKMSLENKLSPELQKALQDLRDFNSKISTTRQKLEAMRANKKGFLDGSVQSDIESLNLLKQKMLSTTDTGTKKRLRADLVSAYNTEMQRLNQILRSQNGVFKEKIATTNRLYNAQNRLTKQTNQYKNSLSGTTNAIVRHIRQIESFLVAMYGVKKAYDATLGVGFEFNRVIENETNGLKLLIVQNMKNADSMGRTLSLKEKYAIAEQKAYDMMQKIKQINPETPYALSDTTKVFKALYPQLVKYGASMKDIANITKKFTIIAKANNLEVDQFIRTVDTAFSGQMAESQLKQVLGRMGLTNKAIKEVISNGNLLSFIKNKFKEVDSDLIGIAKSYDNAVSAFKTSWETLWGEIQKPIFDKLNISIREFTQYLNENNDTLVKAIPQYANTAIEIGKFIAFAKLASIINKKIFINTGISLFNKKLLVATRSMRGFGLVARANLPFLAIVGAFEAFNYVMNESEKKAEQLNNSLHLVEDTIRRMSKTQLSLNKDVISNQIKQMGDELRQKRIELSRALQGKNDIGLGGIFAPSKEDTLELQKQVAELQKQKEQLREKYLIINDTIQARQLENEEISKQNAQILNNLEVQANIVPTALAPQLAYQNAITNALNTSSISANNVANQAQMISIELYNAKTQAYGLDRALGMAVAGVEKQLIRAREIAGQITKAKALSLSYNVDTEAIKKQFSGLNEKFKLATQIKDEDKRNKELNKLNIEAVKLYEQKLTLANNYNQQIKQETELEKRKSIELQKQQNTYKALKSGVKNASQVASLKNIDLDINRIKSSQLNSTEKQLELTKLLNQKLQVQRSLQNASVKAGKRALAHKTHLAKVAQHHNNIQKVSNQETEKQKSIIKQIEDIKKNWWNFNKDAVKVAKEKLNLATVEKNTLKGYSNKVEVEKAVTKEYKARLDLLKAQQAQLKNIYSIYSGGVGSIFKGDLKGGLSSIFSGLSSTLIKPLQSQISSYLTKTTGSFLTSLSPLMGGLLGGAMSLLPSLLSSFSSKLTDAEIKSATGRKEFDSKYFENSLKLWTTYAKNGNSIAIRQLDRLRDINANLTTIALGSASTQNGFRLDGKDMVSSKDNGFFGLFASSKTPLGSGIEILTQSIKQLTSNIQARGYQSYKVTDSGFFGLFGGESIQTNYRGLSSPLTRALQETVNKSLDSVADNLQVLGFSSAKFKEAIQQQVVSLGKIDFKDITDPTQQMQVLKQGIGEMLGNAVNGALSSFADPQMLQSLYSWQKAGEDILSTTSRVAVGFQEVGIHLAFFGQHLDSFNQSQELIKAAGGLEAFSSGMQTFIKGFFSTAEQKQFLQMQLQYALGVYNVALPASKAQFRALVLEVQQKILTTKATIQALKAEITAKVASGKMSLAAAYGQLQGETAIANARGGVIRQQIGANNFLVRSAQQAGEASVGFGKSVHNAVGAMITGAGEAIKKGAEVTPNGVAIDYSRITSPAIAQAKAELSKLEGTYSTLMSNMSSFSSYYNDMGSAISGAGSAAGNATDKFDNLTKSLIAIAQLKAEWGDNPIEGAKLVLEATKKVTGLTTLTYENFLEKFKELTKNGKGLKDKTLQKWRDMSSALKALHDAQNKAIEGLKKLKEHTRGVFTKEFTFNTAQIAGSLNRAINNKDWTKAQSNYDALVVEYKAEGLNREQYYLKMANLNSRIDKIPNNPNAGVEKRLDKVVDELEALRAEYKHLKEIADNTSKTAQNTDSPLIVEAG